MDVSVYFVAQMPRPQCTRYSIAIDALRIADVQLCRCDLAGVFRRAGFDREGLGASADANIAVPIPAADIEEGMLEVDGVRRCRRDGGNDDGGRTEIEDVLSK